MSRTRPRTAGLLLPLALCCSTVAPAAAQDLDRRTRKEVEELIERYVRLDGRTAEGHGVRRELLARVHELVPGELDRREVERWTELVHEAWREGPELPTGSGREYFWEDERRGLYILGGQTRRPKGLVVGMHGGGVGSGDCAEAAGFLSSGAKGQRWLGIFPEVLEKTEHGWTTAGTEEWVLELVERARRTFDLDPDRIYLAGHSMGGYGSWTLGGHHADQWAAIGPAAGAPTPYLNAEGEVWAIEDGVVPNLRNLPARVFQSADDPKVPPDANRVAVKKVEEARERWGGFEHFEYIEVDGHGHAYPPGGGDDWLEALAGYERDPHPRKVVWQAALPWKRQFYWLHQESPVAGTIVVAEVLEDNLVRVECSRPAPGLEVLLSSELVDLEREVVVEVDGRETWRGVPRATLATILLTGAGGDPGRTYACRVPAH